MSRFIGLACAALAGCVPSAATPFAAAASSPHVLFVQLAGEVLQGASSDDATVDHSAVALQAPSGVATVPPFDPNQVAPGIAAADVGDVLFDRIRTLLAPWDVTLVRTRPSSGAFTLVAVGGDFMLVGTSDGVAGLASGVDCADGNPSNVVYDFSDDQSPGFGGVVSVAATAAHEAGHAYGLEHTDDPLDLMYAGATPPSFLDAIGASLRETGAYSSFGAGGLSGPESCGRGNPVNAGVLTAHLGASVRSDTTKPTLSVQGAPPGTMTAVASDDTGVVRVEVYVNFALVDVLKSPPYLFNVPAASQSFYLTIEAVDAAANRASQTHFYFTQVGDDMSPSPDDAAASDDAGVDGGTPAQPSGGCSFATTSPSTSTFTFAFAFTFTFAFAFTGASPVGRYRRARRAKSS